MKKLLPAFLIVTFLVFSSSVFSQRTTKVEKLQALSETFSKEWEANRKQAEEFAKLHQIPIVQELENGSLLQLINVENGIPVYRATDNFGAAETTRANELWEGGSSGYNLNGEGYDQLGQWDGGHVRLTHQEFYNQGESRVENMDESSPTHFHATHVAGTLIAAGVNNSAKGMSNEGTLKAWDWDNDNSEMASAAAQGLEISNHSYNIGTGWVWNNGWQWYGNSAISPLEDYKFGFYTTAARAIDQIAYNAPNYLIFRSAGNDRGSGPGDAGTGDKPEKDGGTDGYDCIPVESISKNIMTVGAVYELTDYEQASDVQMSSFSSWGPADDGRIKPDIVGKGVSVFSTMDGSNTDYQSLDGTSMASPNVAGSAALLQQHHQNLFETGPMRSATLKALIIHSADEAGDHEGPDYRFGWGLMNAERAANMITIDTMVNVMSEKILAEGETYSRVITTPGDTDLRVTICWNDPPALPVPPSLNPRDPMLVNDLDLKLVDADNNNYYPYMLNPDNPSNAATTNGKNNVDNVEMIYFNNAPAGEYTVIVDHDGELKDDEQAFSIVITGSIDLPEPECSSAMINPMEDAGDVLLNEYISWMPAHYADSYLVYFGTDGGGNETPTNVFNGESFETNGFDILLAEGMTYYLQVVPVNEIGTATGCNQIWEFTTMEAIDLYPNSEDFTDVNLPEPPFGYQIVNNSDAEWVSVDYFGHNDDYSMICANPEGLVETNYNNWLISPPYRVSGGKEYNVLFFYTNLYPGTSERLSLYWSTTPHVEDMDDRIFNNSSFDSNSWLEGDATFTPDTDTVIFFAFKAYSANGFGIYLDDFTVDGWTVGFNQPTIEDDILVYNYLSNITIKADDKWNGADIRITNLMGQLVYSSQYQEEMTINFNSLKNKGIYIVSLRKGENFYTRKLFLK